MDAAKTNFLIIPTSKVISHFLTSGIRTAQIVKESQLIASKLVGLAEHAYSLRDMTTVEQTAQLLAVLPLERAQSTARYFLALCDKRAGRVIEAEHKLDILMADQQALPSYRARAMHAFGIIHHERGDLEQARQLYFEAVRYIRHHKEIHYPSLVQSLLLIAATHTYAGEHQEAFDQLESIWPLVKVVSRHRPLYHGVFCNNTAVELLKLGRLDEAEAYSKAALLSPFAPAYPEWQETAKEIEQQAKKKPTRNRKARSVAKRARETSPKSKIRLVKKPDPITLPATTRRRIGSGTIIKLEPPRCRPILEQICLKIRIRAPSF